MKMTLRIAWFQSLEEAWVEYKNYESYITQTECLEGVGEFTGEGDTEAECLAQIYSKLFYENWTSADSISRFI